MTGWAGDVAVVGGRNKLVSPSARWGRPDLSTRDIIHWECQSPEHRALHSRHGNGGLTIHEGAWAYCDGAGANETHRWSPTGGVALESLVRWTMPNGASTKDEQPLVASALNGNPSATNGHPKVSRKATGVRRT